MKTYKRAIVVLLNIILVSLIGLVIKDVLYQGLPSYVKGIRYFGIGHVVGGIDIFLLFGLACFLFLIQRLIKFLLRNNSNSFIEGVITGILGVLLFCVFAGFVVGFRVSFDFAGDRLKNLLPLLIMGFVLPSTEKWVSKLFKLDR